MAKILIAEHEDIVRNTIVKILDRFGYETVSVATGKEALKAVEEGSLDLVLLDGDMEKGVNGIDICRKIRETHPREALPIIGMSGWGAAYGQKYEEAGANDYLPKPFNIDALREIIMRYTSDEGGN